MPGSFREPLEAKVLDDPAPQPAVRRTGGSWLLASGAFVLFVVCFAGLMWGLGKLLQSAATVRASRSDSLVDHWESNAERVTAVRAALEADDVGLTGAEQRDLRRFFDKVRDALQPQGQSAFLPLVDLKSCAERILRHPASRAKSRSDRGLLEQQLMHRIHAPEHWTELSIVRGQRNPQGDEALVYTIASRWESPPCLVRWWLRREGRSWRICDWERIDHGWSEAAQWAWEGGSENTTDQTAYRQALGNIQSAESHFDADHLALGARDLLRVTADQLPAALHDAVQIELAWAWDQCGRSDQVLAACDRLHDPASFPASEYLRALAYSRREDFAAVAAAAERYRAAAGRHPHLLEVEASAREALGQRAQASECWWQRLALLPEDTTALAEFCRLSDESGAARAATILARARQPRDYALSVARTAIFRDDEATLRAVEQYLRQTSPQSAAVELVAAWRMEQRGEFEAAARHFQAAAARATDADERREHQHQYLDAMARAGRAGKAMAASSEPREALAYLTHGLEYEEASLTLKDLPPLIEQHRQRDPQDPRLAYLEGLLALQAGNFAEAATRFQQVLSGPLPTPSDATDDLAGLSRSKLREALYRQNRLAEAYQAAEGEEFELGFRRLGWLCNNDENWPALDELIRLHKRRKPDDPWIDYFLALRAQAQGDSAAALLAVQRAEASTDETLRQTLAWLKNQLLIQSGGISEAYSNSSDQREAFRRLVTHLSNQEDWEGVLELVNLHSSQAPRRSSTLYWSVAAHWHRGEYQEVVDGLTPWPEDRVTRLEAGQLSELCDLLVRSHLRLGHLQAAEAAAQRARDEYGVEPPAVALKLAQGDQAGLVELLQQPRIARAVFDEQIYHDRDLAALLTDPDLAAIRRKQALPVPNDENPHYLTLVLFFPQAITAEQLQACVASSGAAEGAASMKGCPNRESRLWDRGLEALVLTSGSGAYCPADSIPNKLAVGDPRRRVLENHAGWVALDLLSADATMTASDLPALASKLAMALELLQPQAAYLSTRHTRRIELCDNEVRRRLASGEYVLTALAKPAANAKRSPASSVMLFARRADEPDAAQRFTLGRSVRQLADRARVENAAGCGHVRIELRRGHACEEQWLKVIRSRRLKFGDDEFIAEMTADSRLWPFLQTGERLHLPAHEVLEVRPAATESTPSK